MHKFSILKYLSLLFLFSACSTTFQLQDRFEDTQNIHNQTSDEETSLHKFSEREPSLNSAEDSIGAFPIVRNSDVEKWITYFQTTAKRSFTAWMQRGEPFKTVIEEALENEGVPGTLFYLSLIESGFEHRALSPAKASGPWQFLRDTGRQYGLHSNAWIDERRDPVKSTHAAAAYLRDLRKKFGDWYLSVAAYNGGPKTISDAIKKGGTNDFWKLKKMGLLKRETGDFVPKMIAAAIVGNNLSQFGFSEISKTHEKFPETKVLVKNSVKIADLAKKLSIPTSTLRKWNPELLKDSIPPRQFRKQSTYALRVQKQHVQKFAEIESQLQAIPETKKTIRTHRIAKGETLDKIAKRYQVTVKELLDNNPQVKSRKIAVGTIIRMPASDKHG